VQGQDQIKNQLVAHLKGGEAFVPIEELLKSIPYGYLGKRTGNLPYSFYEVFFHIWYTQKDILDYCIDDNYKLPQWPQDYWPESHTPENLASWNALKDQYFEDRNKFIKFIQKPATDLLAEIGKEKKHSTLREILLVIEHSAYHTGQLVVIQREIGTYGK
jgi:uncharacterized damage-inducible protein DinB